MICIQNKEAEAKEELKRRAKQLEMQRREQQRRTAAGGLGGGGYLGGGISGYAPVSQRYDAPTPARTVSPAPIAVRTPQFKKSGMQLGSKKTTQSQLLDALGGEALLSEDMSVPGTPAPPEPAAAAVHKDERGSLPVVTPERYAQIVLQNPLMGVALLITMLSLVYTLPSARLFNWSSTVKGA